MFVSQFHNILGMLRLWIQILGLALPCAALAQPAPQRSVEAFHASYQTYAAGVLVAKAETGLTLSPWNYQMSLRFRTTGMAGFFFRGQQLDQVTGSWKGGLAEPARFLGQGQWRGADRLTEIDYRQGSPVIRQLLPPDPEAREPVANALREHTIDSLSALVELIHNVADTGRCETKVHTFDGRRVIEIEAHTFGQDELEHDSRSSYAGPALRCDFSGRTLAGFKLGDDRQRESKPVHGSAWLAPLIAGGPPLPVRLAFETKWFGDATMYLTAAGPGSDLKLVSGTRSGD